MVKKYWTFINISLHVLFYGETARARSGAMLQLVGNRGLCLCYIIWEQPLTLLNKEMTIDAT